MNTPYLFLYGITIMTIAITGAVLYQKAKRKEETNKIKKHYANWGN